MRPSLKNINAMSIDCARNVLAREFVDYEPCRESVDQLQECVRYERKHGKRKSMLRLLSSHIEKRKACLDGEKNPGKPLPDVPFDHKDKSGNSVGIRNGWGDHKGLYVVAVNKDCQLHRIKAVEPSEDFQMILDRFREYAAQKQLIQTDTVSPVEIKHDPVEAEHLPPGSNSQRVDNLNDGGAEANIQRVEYLENEANQDPVVMYHIAAERCGNLAVWCAAMSGAELLKKKKELPRGQFGPYKESLPLSAGTIHNYMHFARKLDRKIKLLPDDEKQRLLDSMAGAQEGVEVSLELLNLPSPTDVFAPAHDRIAEVIRKVTNEQTLRQLFFDWDIVKKPKALGGKRDQKKQGKLDRHEARKQAITERWANINEDLTNHGLLQKTFAQLERADLQRLADTLKDLITEVNAALEA